MTKITKRVVGHNGRKNILILYGIEAYDLYTKGECKEDATSTP